MNPYRYRFTNPNRQVPAYNDDSEEKQACRDMLIKATKKHLRKPPKTIFTLPGRRARCAMQFHDNWPHADIIGIDVERQSCRLNAYRNGFKGLFCNTLDEYVRQSDNVRNGRDARPLTDFTRQGRADNMRRIFVSDFDYPKYDLSYLDFTGNLDGTVLESTVKFIDHEANGRAVVGVTYQYDVENPNLLSAEGMAGFLMGRCKSRLALGGMLEYHAKMVGIVLLKSG